MTEEKIATTEEITVRGGKFYAIIKRCFDFLSSLVAIALCLPLFLALMILVAFSSRGKMFYRDKRVGKRGKPIRVYKFRTMVHDAETNVEKYLSSEQLEQWQQELKLDNDPRITRIGKFLRKTSLDELPQLFNILFGSLSVVGPRPVCERELSNFTDEQREKLLSVKPGLTGCWQVYGRKSATYENGERQKLELLYLKKRGFFYDLKLIFLTIPAVLRQEGAK